MQQRTLFPLCFGSSCGRHFDWIVIGVASSTVPRPVRIAARAQQATYPIGIAPFGSVVVDRLAGQLERLVSHLMRRCRLLTVTRNVGSGLLSIVGLAEPLFH